MSRIAKSCRHAVEAASQQLKSALSYLCFLSAKNSLNIFKLIRPWVPIAFIATSAPALAQVYSWKDPASGQSRFSTIPPPWYDRGETVRGPRVTATAGERVIDDTALPYEDRLILSGKSRDYVDKLRLQPHHGPTAAQSTNGESVRTQGDNRRPADQTAIREKTVSNKGS